MPLYTNFYIALYIIFRTGVREERPKGKGRRMRVCTVYGHCGGGRWCQRAAKKRKRDARRRKNHNPHQGSSLDRQTLLAASTEPRRKGSLLPSKSEGKRRRKICRKITLLESCPAVKKIEKKSWRLVSNLWALALGSRCQSVHKNLVLARRFGDNKGVRIAFLQSEKYRRGKNG